MAFIRYLSGLHEGPISIAEAWVERRYSIRYNIQSALHRIDWAVNRASWFEGALRPYYQSVGICLAELLQSAEL